MKKQEIKNFICKLKRKPDSHKYDFGHVLVIAGSKTMPGSGALCCLGAFYSGAGLVTYAVNENFLIQACSLSRPETLFYIYKTASDILNYVKLRKVTSIVIGPGLKSDYKFVHKIISSVNIPTVLDASGISVFNGISGKLNDAKSNLILTPHLGEFSKLLNISIDSIKSNRAKIAADFADKNSLICVLKGKDTLVVSDGKIYTNNTGTPAMATAGSGDVLSGMIAAFINIDYDIFEAVKFAVFVHGLAGELAEKEKCQISIVASDIAENIYRAIKQISH
ncbi:NAD(P)H-hydrate dehydratase [Candidatus Endomicrobiellum devescovinae]|jgi:NAD(P)H-hydrate epimerase|uniref:NAD(P)H-hydrate dehydratase n=1 Tax=Candidatus Endomicrobiellum devescovinae TaxID=3242322 RepID=UPI0028320C9C|nr:NAD(P)H-hydrate dehydratase [Endomicrobium sp.]